MGSCAAGLLCLNPEESNRPTKIKRNFKGEIFEYCSYCRSQQGNGHTPPSQVRDQEPQSSKIPSSVRGVLEILAGDEGFKRPPASPPFEEESGGKKPDPLRQPEGRGGDMGKEAGVNGAPRPQQPTNHRSQPLLGQNSWHASQVFSEGRAIAMRNLDSGFAITADLNLEGLGKIGRIFGLDVGANITAFLNSGAVGPTTRQALVDYIRGSKSEEVSVTLGAMAVAGRHRVHLIWNHGTGEPNETAPRIRGEAIDPDIAALIEAARSSGVQLIISDAVPSLLSKKGADGTFEIVVNPLFAASLTDKSLADAIAHEYYHHLNRHYDDMDFLVSEWRKAYGHSVPKDLERKARELANFAVDCVTNTALGINHLEVKASPGSATFGRDLFIAAAAAGRGLCEIKKGGSLGLLVKTPDTINTFSGTQINIHNDSLEDIFRKLVSSEKL